MQAETTRVRVGRDRRAHVQRTVDVKQGLGSGTGLSTVDASWMAGLQAAKAAKTSAGTDLQLGVVFSTLQHDLAMVVKGVSYGLGGQVPLVGATTYGYVFDNHQISDLGVAVLALGGDHSRFSLGIGQGLGQDVWRAAEDALRPILQQWEQEKINGYTHLSVVFFVDTFVNGEILLEALIRHLPEEVPVMGGVVDEEGGSEQTALIYGKEVVRDALICIGVFTRHPVGMGNRHGFFPLVPRRVTRAAGTIIYELDGKPAIEVWKEFLKRRNVPLPEDLRSFGEALSRYQFAVPDPMQPGHSKIRLPLGITPEGGIKLAGEVPDRATIWILEAREERMLEALEKAFEAARQRLNPAEPLFGVVMQGFPRIIALGEEGALHEFEKIQELFGEVPYIGVNTYGEIIRVKDEPRGFSNSSVNLALFPQTVEEG